MEELEKIRQSTIEAQKKKESLKEMRDRILADRMKAARDRVKVRTGIVIEEPKIEETHVDPKDHMDLEAEKQKAPKNITIKEDLRREKARKDHVRPWDKHKKGGSDSEDSDKEWKPKKEYTPVSQDVWNERNRQVRKPEFAPCYDKSESSYKKSSYTAERKTDLSKTSYTSVPGYYQEDPQASTYSSSSKNSNKARVTRSYQKDNETEDLLSIPLPEKRPKIDSSNQRDLESSIEAGLKFLRQQNTTDSVEKQMQNKNKWTSYKE